MAKRWISVLLILAVLAGLLVVPTAAAEPEQADAGVTAMSQICPCGCGKTLDAVQWRIWNINAEGDPPSGHYYLAEDYAQARQVTIMSGNRVVLDLRGHTLTSQETSRMFLDYGYMAVMDTAGGGRILGNTTGSGYGGVLSVATYETNFSKFELYSGTIMVERTGNGSLSGGLISVTNTCTFEMHGGLLLNGSTKNPAGKAENGGAIRAVAGATVKILGGSIIGGYSTNYGGSIYSAGTTILENCRIIGGVAEGFGGNIYQTGGSLTIGDNCYIADGASLNNTSQYQNGGGNICTVNGARVTIRNSEIRNGYAAYNGGNLFLGSGEHTIENTKISAGVCDGVGGNLMCNASDATTRIVGGEIAGDVSYTAGKLTLEGAVKIGLNNTGLNLMSGTTTTKITASGLTQGAEIYVNAGDVFTNVGAKAAYFKPAMRTVLAETDQGLKGTQAASGEQGGYCPHCGKTVVWAAFDSSATYPADGHYYLTASLSNAKTYYIGNGSTYTRKVVLDLNGYDITAKARAFYVRSYNSGANYSTFAILDSVGGSVVQGRGNTTASQGGGVLYNETADFTIYGGKYVYAPCDYMANNGGIIWSGGVLKIHGGVFDASAYETPSTTSTKNYGGAIYQGYAATGTRSLTMTAGRVMGGKAVNGGALYAGGNMAISISGGQFTGGEAVQGGNIYCAGSDTQKAGTLEIRNCAVTDGTASTGYGNLYLAYYDTLTVENAYIADGTSSDYGGNMNLPTNSVFATVEGCTVINGNAKRGGNVYAGGTGIRTKMENCLIVAGVSKNHAGNFNAGNGYLHLIGSQVLFGKAGTYGGNIAMTAGNAAAANYLRIEAAEDGTIPLIAGGKAGTYGGNMYVKGNAYVDEAQFGGGVATNAGQDLYLEAKDKNLRLEIGTGVTGEFVMGVAEAQLGTPIYGNPVTNTVCKTLNAKIYLDGDANNAMLCAGNNELIVGAVAVVPEGADAKWYTDITQAAENCGEDAYLKLCADSKLEMKKDLFVDLNGYRLDVSGSGKLYGMDSTGDAYTTAAGKAVWADVKAVDTAKIAYAPNGNKYISVVDGSVVTYHRLGVELRGVSLRPSVSGVFFRGEWACDEVLADQIVEYGVAVSLKDMPGADFRDEDPAEGEPVRDSLWTSFEKDSFVNGEVKTGVLISNILKTAEQSEKDEDAVLRTPEMNASYGKMPIYATAYITFADGNTYVSDDEQTDADDVKYSLFDVMDSMDAKIQEDPEHYRRYNNAMRDFYQKWKPHGLDAWEFDSYAPIVEDDVIDVLLIGSSASYYYVEELHAIAAAAGIKMRVCNVYYSGCRLQWHWEWWQSGEKQYQFFNTDENGRVGTDNVSLEWCLAQGNWDVISMLESYWALRNKTLQQQLDGSRVYRTELYDYLKEQFPNARFFFQQGWAYETGYNDNGYVVTSFEQQAEETAMRRAFAWGVCEENDVLLYNNGDAWEIFRENIEVNGLSDTLCARLGRIDNEGVMHGGDDGHDGDIGGGQLLNACVWYELITGLDCRDNPYRPVYQWEGETFELSDELVEAIQYAAHEAVQNPRT